MDCPDRPEEESHVPSLPSVTEVLQSGESPWGDVSQLSQPSSGATASLKLPLSRNDIGVSTTPEGRVIKSINEAAIDQGYDSDGLRAPWEVSEQEDIHGPLEEEDPLPFGITPVPPVVPTPQKISQLMKWDL